MVQKVHGAVAAGEKLGRNLQFFEIATDVDIRTGNAVTQAKLDKLVEVISLGGQPVILGAPTVDSGTYTFKFATEHYGAWTERTLASAIIEHAGHLGFTANGVTITVSDTL